MCLSWHGGCGIGNQIVHLHIYVVQNLDKLQVTRNNVVRQKLYIMLDRSIVEIY